MNQCLCRGLAATVLMSAIGAPLPAEAEQAGQLGSVTRVGDELEASLELVETSAVVPASPQPGVADAKDELVFDGVRGTVIDDQTQINPTVVSASPRDSTLVTSEMLRVISHPLDDHQAATLYVHNIPVLTFVGPALTSLSDKEQSQGRDQGDTDAAAPSSRAQAVAQQLEQFHQQSGDPAAIQVRWDSSLDEYVIHLADDDLVMINGDTILPDTTDNFAEDALQATNRLRRLLGGADPLAAVAGRPEPEPVTVSPTPWNVTSTTTGRASWYGPGFHGRRTASGERFNQNAMTAAHRTLPFGTLVRVTNMRNNRQVVVRINDRGPYSHGRILDLSAGAARTIGLDRAGVGPVRLEVLSQ